MKLVLDGVRRPLAHFDLDVSAEISGGVTGIFGPSGAGKTSLLETVAGLLVPRAGRIALDGVVLDDRAAGTHVAARHRRIGYVPQENALFPHLSAIGNIRYGAAAAPSDAVVASVDAVLDILELRPFGARRVTELSGGEQKRVALARALVTAPRLLLLDEPLTGLDRPLHGRILAFLRAIRDEFRLPMLYVTHDPAELEAIAEETVVLDRGRVTAIGPTAEVVGADGARGVR
jgi:molybdate transport system ATP-binding protein